MKYKPKVICYYNDNWCRGKVIPVNSFHGHLCKRCAREVGSIKDEPLDHDFSINER